MLLTNNMPETLTNLGIAGAILFVLFKLGENMLRYFCNTITKKDDYIRQIVNDFNTTMNNHIDHETRQREKETQALNALIQLMVEKSPERKKQCKRIGKVN